VASFAENMKTVRHTIDQALNDRQESLTGLRWVEHLTGAGLSFDPSFPVEGSMTLPKTAEQRVLGIVSLLRKLIVAKPAEAA